MINNTINKLYKNEVIKHTSIYLTNNILIKGIDILSLFIFAKIMMPSAYGQIEIFRNLIALVTTLAGLKISAGLKRYYFEDNSNIGRGLYTSVIIILITNIIIFILYAVAVNFEYAPRGGYALIVIGVTNSIFDLYKNYLQASMQSKKYLIYTMIFRITLLIFSMIGVFLAVPNMFNGYRLACVVSYSLIGCFSAYQILKKSVYKIDIGIFKYLLKFSLPMIPATISGFILSYFDRIMIASIDSYSNSGIYSFAYNIALFVSILVMSINQSWQPVFYKLRKANKFQQINRNINFNMIIVTIFSIMVILFSQEIFMIFPREYSEGKKLVGIIIIGLFLTYIYSIYLYYATFHKKISLVSINSIITSALNIVLNWIFIPILGYEAAAYTTLISYLFMVLVYYISVNSFIEKRCYPLYKVFIPLVLLALLSLIVNAIDTLQYWVNLIIRGGLALISSIIFLVYLKNHKKIFISNKGE